MLLPDTGLCVPGAIHTILAEGWLGSLATREVVINFLLSSACSAESQDS